MQYKEPIKKYIPDEMNNPYLLAQKEWDDRIGSARVQAANWRIMAFSLMALCMLLTAGLIYQGSQSKIRPYMVHINTDGSAQNMGPIPAKYNPQLPEIKYFLSQFVTYTQSLPLDPVVAKQNWVKAYMFLRPAAATKMNKYVSQQNPFSLIGKETREVTINVIAPVSGNTYQVRWKLDAYDEEGNHKRETYMTGMFTIDIASPKDEKVLAVNPLGLYIRDFNFAKEQN